MLYDQVSCCRRWPYNSTGGRSSAGLGEDIPTPLCAQGSVRHKRRARSDPTHRQSTNCPRSLTEPRENAVGKTKCHCAKRGAARQRKQPAEPPSCSLGVWASTSRSCAAGTAAFWRCKCHRMTAKSSRRSHHQRARTIGWPLNRAAAGSRGREGCGLPWQAGRAS